MGVRTASTLLLVLAVVLPGAACGSDGADPVTSAPPATHAGTENPSVAPSEEIPDAPSADTSAAPATTDSAALDDGRHPAYLHGLDVDTRTLTVDVIQFLTGEDAVEAFHADHPEEEGGPPNDYYIVNENPRMRTLPVANDATIEVVRLQEDADADLDPGTWEELPEYFSDYATDDGRLSANPFWLTVTDGVVTGIEEQYLP